MDYRTRISDELLADSQDYVHQLLRDANAAPGPDALGPVTVDGYAGVDKLMARAHHDGYWQGLATVVMLAGITPEPLRRLADVLEQMRSEIDQ